MSKLSITIDGVEFTGSATLALVTGAVVAPPPPAAPPPPVVPAPEPTPEPEPEPPVDVPDNIVYGNPITKAMIGKVSRTDTLLNIPARPSIYVEKITTTDSTTAYGQLVLHEVVGEPHYRNNFWLSKTPGGEPIEGSYKGRSNNYTPLMWTSWKTTYAYLEPNSTYWLNIEHTEVGEVARIDRWVRTLRL